jgi:hypothetical protein
VTGFRLNFRLMSLVQEILELLTVILPVIITIIPLFLPLNKLSSWVIAILVTATTSLVSTGLLMMRSLATCFDTAPTCSPDQQAISHLPGLFDGYRDCTVCVATEQLGLASSIAAWINAALPHVAIALWASCSLLSVWIIARFTWWCRQNVSLRR